VALAAAVKDATAAFEAVRQYVAQGAVESAKLKGPLAEAAQQALMPPAQGTQPTQPSLPTGPGTAMPLAPPPPQGGELAGVPGAPL